MDLVKKISRDFWNQVHVFKVNTLFYLYFFSIIIREEKRQVVWYSELWRNYFIVIVKRFINYFYLCVLFCNKNITKKRSFIPITQNYLYNYIINLLFFIRFFHLLNFKRIFLVWVTKNMYIAVIYSVLYSQRCPWA